MSKFVLPSIASTPFANEQKVRLPSLSSLIDDVPQPRLTLLPSIQSSHMQSLNIPSLPMSMSPGPAFYTPVNSNAPSPLSTVHHASRVSEPIVYYEPPYLPPLPGYHYQPPQVYQLQLQLPAAIKPVSKQASAWTAKDDKLLRFLKGERKLGWREVATYFPSRTANACQFRWRRLVSALKLTGLKKLHLEPKLAGKSSVSYLLNV